MIEGAIEKKNIYKIQNEEMWNTHSFCMFVPFCCIWLHFYKKTNRTDTVKRHKHSMKGRRNASERERERGVISRQMEGMGDRSV